MMEPLIPMLGTYVGITSDCFQYMFWTFFTWGGNSASLESGLELVSIF